MADFVGMAAPLTAAGLARFLARTGTAAADLWAVLAVETSGCGFLPDRRPKILFERHSFHALTGGAYGQSHPDISAPAAGGYGLGGANQYNRLAEALLLNREAALRSTSWGIGQVMGANFAAAGYGDVEAMVAGMVAGEDEQLAAMGGFLEASRLARSLARHDWVGFALGYNGPNYARHNYDGLLRQFHARFSAGPAPDLAVRAVQLALIYLGYDVHGGDGLMGPATVAAIRQFQGDSGLAPSGCIDEGLLACLGCGDAAGGGDPLPADRLA